MAQVPSSTPPQIRKFAVQHVETTTRLKQPDKETTSTNLSRERRLAPQPEDTSVRSDGREGERVTYTNKFTAPQEGKTQDKNSAKPRRFAPQLIETTKRTRKKGDTTPALKHTDKTDLSPGDRVHLPRHMRLIRPFPGVPSNTPMQSSDKVPQFKESRFSSSNIGKDGPCRISFRVPCLEPIFARSNSEESNDSNVPSLSTTPSALSDEIEVHRRASRAREAYNERFSGYLLELAAKAAKRQLKEQAFAAYPNENEHEPVDHFAVDRDSDGSYDGVGYDMLPQTLEQMEHMTRRESAVGWNLEVLQRHKEMLEEQRRQQSLLPPTIGEPTSFVDPFRNPFIRKDPTLESAHNTEPPRATIGGPVQETGELSRMRSAASPPMLGRDIQFRECPSPQYTMIDPTQRPKTRAEGAIARKHSGLWTPSGGATPNRTRNNSLSGLWHGVCNSKTHNCLIVPASLQTGILTPALESDDPFLSPLLGDKHQLPSSPTTATVAGIDDVLSVEAGIDEEYPDCFVTQIYNYLSLGYPSLAWKYDEELGKISKMPLADIRKGDARANSKGYVGVPEGEGATQREVREQCGRWMALRLYIREWARQQPRMVAAESDNWGARARRGSWAI